MTYQNNENKYTECTKPQIDEVKCDVGDVKKKLDAIQKVSYTYKLEMILLGFSFYWTMNIPSLRVKLN